MINPLENDENHKTYHKNAQKIAIFDSNLKLLSASILALGVPVPFRLQLELEHCPAFYWLKYCNQ